jgi:transcriptional regulator with PAS, ATPase and Fis domain
MSKSMNVGTFSSSNSSFGSAGLRGVAPSSVFRDQGILTTDENGCVRTANNVAIEIFSMAMGNVVGGDLTDVLDPKMRDHVKSKMASPPPAEEIDRDGSNSSLTGSASKRSLLSGELVRIAF